MRSSPRKSCSWCILLKTQATRSLPTLEHIAALSDDVGVIQHAVEDVPNRSTGYCTDDVARGFIVALAKLEIDPEDALAARLASTYLSFLHHAQLPDGRFHNFMSYDRRWLDTVGTHDSVGRALWALGYGMRYAPRRSWRRACKALFDNGLRSLEWLRHARSQSYAMIGLAHAAAATEDSDASSPYRPMLADLSKQLEGRYLQAHAPDWQWFEDAMTYDNARLPEAMVRAAAALDDPQLLEIGIRTLDFLERVTVQNAVFVPIGNDGWYPRTGPRSRYAQQPLEAAAMVDAALVAYDVTAEPRFRGLAQLALDWYYGRNSRGVVMARNGGCLDGLDEHSVNLNMGAESSLAYLAGAYALASRPAAALSVAR